LDRYGSKGVFQRTGEVSDTFIPQGRLGRRGSRYGFVRFKSYREANRSIFLLNNAVLRRKRIQVSMARAYERDGRQGGYGKPTRPRQSKMKQIWRRKEPTNTPKVVINQGSNIQAYKILGESSTVAVEWLQRSLVCKSREPTAVQTLTDVLVIKAGMQIQIRAMSCYKS